MADWTIVPDTNLEPGKPIRSIDGLALRDNPIAISEGAAGAPRVQTAALADDAVTAPKLAETANETTWALGRTAAQTEFAIGTYIVAWNTGTNIARGATVAGGFLSVQNAGSSPNPFATISSLVSVISPPGTWKALTYATGASGEAFYPGFFIRVS